MAVPQIETVELSGRQAVITGSAAASARVLLRGDEGETYAVVVDDRGHFDLSITLPDDSVVLTPEVQQGQDTVKGPQRLVILPDAGLAVIQTDGGGSQRLTPAPLLDAIDSDGQAIVASGRGRPGDVVRILVPGRYETTVKVGDDRRWSTGLAGMQDQGFTLVVNDRTFAYPGAEAGLDKEKVNRIEEVEGGWRLTRRLGRQAFMTSWFPNP